MKNVTTFGASTMILPETIEEIFDLWNNDELFIRNQRLLQRVYQNISDPSKKNYYFILEYIRYGSTEGAIALYWNIGTKDILVTNIRIDFNPKSISKAEQDLQTIITYGIAGIINFLYTKLLFHPSIPIGRMNFRPCIYIEENIWSKIIQTRRTYQKDPSRLTFTGEDIFPAHCLLMDLYDENPFELKKLDIYSKEIWNRNSIYEIREDTVNCAMKNIKADFVVHSLEELLDGRRLYDFRSPCKEDIQFYSKKVIAKYNEKGRNA